MPSLKQMFFLTPAYAEMQENRRWHDSCSRGATKKMDRRKRRLL